MFIPIYKYIYILFLYTHLCIYIYICKYIYLGRGYDTVLNTHAPTQDKDDYSEGTFGEEL